jgi:hypothetical protein
VNLTSNTLVEHIFGRRVLRVQIEAAKHIHQPWPGQVAELKNLGWYVAGLIPPRQKPM